MTLNELAAAAGSTLDRDELLDRSLAAVTRHLRFDRALILLADEDARRPRRRPLGRRQPGDGRRGDRGAASCPSTLTTSQLVQLYHADGPLLFRDADQDPDERNRAFAQMMEVTSFLGTPLVTKGRAVGDPGGRQPRLRPRRPARRRAAAVHGRQPHRRRDRERPAVRARSRPRRRPSSGGSSSARRPSPSAIEEAQAARVAAEAASATKSAFLSSVSHELRTPLTSVVGFSRLIRRRLDEVVFPTVPAGDPKRDRAMRQVSENLGIIVEEGERLTTLINDTLDLAKIEAGRMEWRREPVDIGEVIARATAATASLLDGDRARDGRRRRARACRP